MSCPRVELESLDTLWFQVGGTLCNLACTHCLVTSSPTNRTHEPMRFDDVERHLRDAVRLGVKEYYFTGGEPFLNPDMERILERTLQDGPVTVLTNGLLLDALRCRRLRGMAGASAYSLDLRVSLDGLDAPANDAIRGAGTYERILRGIRNLAAAGLNPVITVTEVCAELTLDEGRRRFFDLLRELGLSKPRLKVLPVFRLGAEAQRTGGYAAWQRVLEGDAQDGDWSHLQCSTCRMVTADGVWVCPILVNEPEARMGARLGDVLGAYPLRHQACWTCHVQRASCRT